MRDGTVADERVADEIDASCRRATDWILSLQRSSGVIGDPTLGFKYYRAPWALTLMGEVDAALGVCAFARANLLRDGRLDGPARVLTDGWAYRDSALMIGAHMLGQYDLSHGLAASLLSWQDPQSGGFANDGLPTDALPTGSDESRGVPPDGALAPSDEMDIPYAAGPGLALIAIGRLDAARAVAGFLDRFHRGQPALPDRFYCFWSRRDQRPIVESDAAFETRFVVDQGADRMQRWTIGGIAAGFLGRLYLAEPDPRYLELAAAYQDFSMAATPAQFGYPSVCKSSWGASLLWQITGNVVYRDWLLRMADWYLAGQEANGWWHPWVENTESDVIEITLEFIMHMRILSGALRIRMR